MKIKKNLFECTKCLDTLEIKAGLISAILDYIGYYSEEGLFDLSVKPDYNDFVDLYGRQTAARIHIKEKVRFVIGGKNFYSNPLDKDCCTDHEIIKLTEINAGNVVESYLDRLQDKLEEQIEDGEWNDYKDCPSKMADRLDYIFNGCIDFHKALGIEKQYRVQMNFDFNVYAENESAAIDKALKYRDITRLATPFITATEC